MLTCRYRAWHRHILATTLLSLGTLGTQSATLHAQTAPHRPVSVIPTLDTTDSDVRQIIALARHFLDTPDSARYTPTLWTQAPEFGTAADDLSSRFCGGVHATIIGVISASPDDSTYVVKILHEAPWMRARIPLAIQRLYAVRAPDAPFKFRLAAAFPYQAASWTKNVVGPISFWNAPSQPFNRVRAEQTVAFADSVSGLLGIPTPSTVMFVAPTLGEIYQGIGLDYLAMASGPGNGLGGRALPNQTILAGDSRLGEAYLHELVHVIQAKAFPSRNGIFGEGIATWLGGAGSFEFRTLHEQVKEFQKNHPDVSIESVLRDEFPTNNTRAGTRIRYGTYGMIVEGVYKRSGMEGLKQLAAMPRDAVVISALPRLLGLAEGEVTPTMWWRQ